MPRRFPFLTSPLSAAVFAVAVPTLAADDRHASDVPPEVAAILGQNRIELPDLFRLAELTSPTLAAARAEVAAGAGRLRRVGAYANPTIGFGIEEASVEDFSDRKEMVEIVQPILLGGRRGPAKATLSAELAATELLLDDVRRDVRGRAHALLIEISYNGTRSDAVTELIAEASRTYEIARRRFEARAVPESHATRALLSRYELELASDRADAERLSAVEQLSALLGGLDVRADQLAAPPLLEEEPDTPLLIERLLTTHPRIAAAHLEIDAAEARHRWVRVRRLPDFDLRAAYGRQVSLDERFIEAGIGIRLPLFDRNQGEVEEALAEVRRANQRAHEAERDLVAQLTVASRRRSLAAQQLTSLRETLEPAAARGLSQARAAYQGGALSFFELLDAQQTYARVRTQTLEIERDLNRATAELSGLAGLGPYQD